MANGELLEKIDDLLEQDKIEPSAALRILLTTNKEILVGQKAAGEERKALKENPLVRVGFFLQNNPKSGYIILLAITAILLIPHIAETYFWGKTIIEGWLGLPAGLLP